VGVASSGGKSDTNGAPQLQFASFCAPASWLNTYVAGKGGEPVCAWPGNEVGLCRGALVTVVRSTSPFFCWARMVPRFEIEAIVIDNVRLEVIGLGETRQYFAFQDSQRCRLTRGIHGFDEIV
jgi:hypothetical protein